MDYALLGPLEVRSDGRPIAVGRGKQRALLAVLALNAGRVVPADRLIDELWGDTPPATAATALQVYVSRLRKSLGEGAIATREPGYLVEGDVDVRHFEELVSQAQRSEPPRAAELLGEALGLWRGAPLGDCELPLEAARLEEQRVAGARAADRGRPGDAAARPNSSASSSRSSPSTRCASRFGPS